MFAATPVAAQDGDKWDWSGFYGGVHVGLGSHKTDWHVDGFEGSSHVFYYDDTTSSTFFLAGLQLGYNKQVGVYVYGIEADVSFFDAGSDTGEFRRLPGNGLTGYEVTTDDPDILATIRARAGWLYNDNVLFFGTAGIALAFEYDATGYVGSGITGDASFLSGLGVVLGGGGEMVVGKNLTLSGTLLYHYLTEGSEKHASGTSGIDAYAQSQFVTAKVGLNYHF